MYGRQKNGWEGTQSPEKKKTKGAKTCGLGLLNWYWKEKGHALPSTPNFN